MILRLPSFLKLAVVLLVAAPLGARATSFDFDDDIGDLVASSVVLSRSAVSPGQTAPAAVVLDITSGWHINSAAPHQDYLIAAEVAFGTVENLTASSLQYPPGIDEELVGELMSVYTGEVIIGFEVEAAGGVAAGEYELPVHVTYQPCNNRECRAPETDTLNLKVTIGDGGRPINEAVFGRIAGSNVPDGTAEAAAGEESDLDRIIREHGFWGYFLVLGIAFVTGLLLSFSPCTYPMIPITVSIFAGQERTVGRGFFLSLIYVGTMAIVYGVMGLVVSLVGGVFGAWLASPPVVIGIAVVFVIFSLSMFGLYDLNVPASLRNKLGATQTGGGVVGSIILGIVAALVVSPCVGPFVAGILLYIATNGSPAIGFLTLFIFAVGLGTLFIIIGTFSSAINRLPRSGEWMETVKKFFGFILLLMAIYFLQSIVSAEVTAIATALLLVAFGVFGGGLDRLTTEAGFFLRLKKFLGVLALLVGGYLLVGMLVTQGFILPAASTWWPGVSSNVVYEETGITGWETDLEQALGRARAEGKPAIIDCWATWCVNCRVLERNTFSKPEVGVAAERFVPIKVQLETADSPETLAFKERFGLKTYSLPTTLLLGSDGEVKKIITGVIGPEEFIAEMARIR
jgi:thiol:disulfide interchange protein DsbD